METPNNYFNTKQGYDYFALRPNNYVNSKQGYDYFDQRPNLIRDSYLPEFCVEGTFLEFKKFRFEDEQSRGWSPFQWTKLKKAFNAMMNGLGGKVIIGINDDSQVTGVLLTADEASDMREYIFNAIKLDFNVEVRDLMQITCYRLLDGIPDEPNKKYKFYWYYVDITIFPYLESGVFIRSFFRDNLPYAYLRCLNTSKSMDRSAFAEFSANKICKFKNLDFIIKNYDKFLEFAESYQKGTKYCIKCPANIAKDNGKKCYACYYKDSKAKKKRKYEITKFKY